MLTFKLFSPAFCVMQINHFTVKLYKNKYVLELQKKKLKKNTKMSTLITAIKMLFNSI